MFRMAYRIIPWGIKFCMVFVIIVYNLVVLTPSMQNWVVNECYVYGCFEDHGRVVNVFENVSRPKKNDKC